jgi:hypothetical protein
MIVLVPIVNLNCSINQTASLLKTFCVRFNFRLRGPTKAMNATAECFVLNCDENDEPRDVGKEPGQLFLGRP